MEPIFAGTLGLVLAASFICLGFVAPIWGFVEACSNPSRSGGGKAGWVLFLMLGWSVSAIVLALWPGSTPRFRQFVPGSTVAAILSEVIGVSSGLMQLGTHPAATTESTQAPEVEEL